MENIRVRDITEAVGGTLLGGDPDTLLRHISIDSRTMKGDDLFVPLVGAHNDAHRFIGQAMEHGAKAALTSEHDTFPLEKGVTDIAGASAITGALIRVEDTKKALQDIGYFLRSRLNLPLVGITGSVGKTTTREMVAAALSAGYRVFKTPANYNSQVGVPITISEIGSEDEIGVLELGMSEPGEMTVIAGIARVDMAVITNVGVTHIENLGTRENILREKLNIQDGLKKGGVLFLNGDNDLLKDVKARDGYETVYYGIGEQNDYRAVDIENHGGKPSFTLLHGEQRVPVKLQVMGEHNILNALAALAVSDYARVPLSAAAERLYEFEGYDNRQQLYENNQITMIDDTYNASPDSMKAGIKVLASIDGRRRIAVLADMKELGAQAPELHYEMGRFLLTQPVDEVVTYGELAKEIIRGISEGDEGNKRTIKTVSFSEEDKNDMINYLEHRLTPGDVVLFKGSNSMNLGAIAAHFIKTEQVKP